MEAKTWSRAVLWAGLLAWGLPACGPARSFGRDAADDASSPDVGDDAPADAERDAADAHATDAADALSARDVMDASDVFDARDAADARDGTADARDAATDAGQPSDASNCDRRLRGTLTLPESSATGIADFVDPSGGYHCDQDPAFTATYAIHTDVVTGLHLQLNRTPTSAVLGLSSTCDNTQNDCKLATDRSPSCTQLDPGDAFVVLGSDWYGDHYDFTVSSFPLPANISCDAAVDLGAGTTLPDESFVGPSALAATCPYAAARHLYYRAQIPANHRASLTVTPLASPWSAPFPSVSTACGGAHIGTAYITDSQQGLWKYDNPGASPLDVVIDLDADLPYTHGAARVSVDFAVQPLPANDECSTALPVTDGTTLEAVDIAASTPAQYPTLYYTVTVPADATLVVMATSYRSEPPQISILWDCATPTGTTYFNGNVTWRNNTGVARSLVLQFNGQPGAQLFDVTFRVLAPAANGTCANATPVADGTRFPQVFDAAGGPGPLQCSPPDAPLLYYSATVPPGYVLAAYHDGPGTASAATFALLSGCGAATCTAGTNTFGELMYQNLGTSPAQAIVAAGPAWQYAYDAVFDLSFALHPPNTNLTCASATPLTDRMHVRGENIGDMRLTNCVAAAGLAYKATLQPGDRLVVLPHNTVRFDLLQSCAPDDCGASVSSPGPLRYANAGTAPQDVYLAAMPSGQLVDFEVALGPPDYTESSIPTQCDDMSGATVIDIESPGAYSRGFPQALPFPFALSGDAVNYYSIDLYGAVQMSPVRAMAAGPDGTEAAIPDPLNDNGFLAPFGTWLLDPIPGAGSDVRFATFGSAPSRHWTVQWTHQTLRGESGSQLTFQAKIFESSNVIEFHYCSLVPGTSTTGTMTTGSQANVGVEGLSGIRGYNHSFHTAGAVSTAAAIRLTPIR